MLYPLPNCSRWIGIVVGVIGMFTASVTPGEGSNEPVKLKDLRKHYFGEVSRMAAPILQKYREELLTLERTCQAQRDYSGAAAVRNERLKAEKRLEAWAKRSPETPMPRPYPGGPITLAAKDAIGMGGVAFNKERDALDGWKNKGCSARWTLPFPLKAGGYDVVLDLACAPGSGGQVTIKEDFHTLTRTISPTKGWADFSSQSLGTLRIKANASGLNLGAVTVEGDGVFLLRAVKLVPATEGPR